MKDPGEAAKGRRRRGKNSQAKRTGSGRNSGKAFSATDEAASPAVPQAGGEVIFQVRRQGHTVFIRRVSFLFVFSLTNLPGRI